MRRVITTGYECYLAVGARRERAADHADRLGLRLGALRRRKKAATRVGGNCYKSQKQREHYTLALRTVT